MIRSVKNNLLQLGISAYLLLAFCIGILYIIVCRSQTASAEIHLYMFIALLLLSLSLVFRSCAHRLDSQTLLLAIILLGCIMRIGYTLYNNCMVRYHDLGSFSIEDNGKAAYLIYLFRYHMLPPSNAHQLYHAPFSYLASALSCQLMEPFLLSHDNTVVGDAGKLASCFASCSMLLMTPKLCRCCRLSSKATRCCTLYVAALPVFYLISGRISEDAFTGFFSLAALLYTFYWDQNPSMKNTILLAVIYGLGLQTALTCILPAPFTLFIFIRHVIVQTNIRKELFLKGMLFACISLPLGLWFYIRNYLKFGQSFTYIFPQGIGGPLWRGGYSLWDRYKPLDLANLFASPYGNPWADYNYPTFFLKSELFGEYQFEIMPPVPQLMLYLHVFLSMCAILYCIYRLIKRKHKNQTLLCILIFYMMLFASYSYLTHPFGCSMDARYFTFFSILKALALGILIGDLSHSDSAPLQKGAGLLQAMVLLFAVLSMVMYCNIY